MTQRSQLSLFLEEMPFTRIFKTFRMAIQPSKLLIAFAAIILVAIIGLLMDLYKVVDAAPYIKTTDITAAPLEGPIITGAATELHAFVAAPDSVVTFKERYHEPANRLGLFSTLALFCSARFTDVGLALARFNVSAALTNLGMCVRALEWAVVIHPLMGTAFLGVAFCVLTLAGGAICRIAALEFANNEKPGFFQALRFARQKYKSLIGAPLAPLALIIVIGLLIALLGLLGNIPYIGELIVALSLPIVLLLGLLMTLVVFGAIGGFNLMYPVIAFESTDSFDAISRSFSYVYANPWRMGFYTIIAGIYGAFCYLFVWFFAIVMLTLTYLFLFLGMFWSHSSKVSSVNKLAAIWPNPAQAIMPGTSDSIMLGWSETAAAFIIFLVVIAVFCAVAAFVISFFFSANTIIYALMRQKVDKTALTEVVVQHPAPATPPNPESLPVDEPPTV